MRLETTEAGSNDAALAINLLGPFRLIVGNKEIELASRKSRALIGYLALTESQEESRERLVGLLWSESSEERARASLRQALHEIRNALQSSGFVGFRTDKLAIALDRAQIRVDLIDVLNAALLLERQNALDDVLGDIEMADPLFQTWVVAKRQTIRDQIIRHLENALRAKTGITPAARDLAQALNNIDQTHEEACRVLIRAFVLDDEIGSALRIYKTLWDLLEAEYDVEPTQQTQDLIAEVKAALPFSGAGATSDLARQPNASDPDPSFGSALTGRSRQGKLGLSIGPFKLSGSGLQKDYLAQGFRQELIGCLVRFREWLVRDWTQESAPGVAAAAIDEFVLDASGYESPRALHFVLTLRDNINGTYLWSENLTLTLDRWHDLQQSLVRRIATALNVHVSAERMNQITSHQAIDMKAHDIWLFGQATLLGFDREKWDRAAELFGRVVHHMPDYAPAFSSLAQLCNSYHIVKPGVARDPERTQQALIYAHEAVRIDPLDSRSQLCLGWSHAMAKQYEQAMIYIPLAHDLNDNDPWTLVSAANCYAFCGHCDRAVAIINAMLQRNMPFAPTRLQWAYHTAIRFISRDYEGCIAAANFAGDLNLNVPGFKAAALYHMGQHDAARAELDRFFTTVRDRWCVKEPATPEAVTRWFLHMFPIARPEDWARLRDGIAGAGAPTSGLFHHQW